MRSLAVVVLLVTACHPKEREAPRPEPSGGASVTADAAPPPVVVVDASVPDAGPTRIVHCKSPEGKYRVDVGLDGDRARTATVLIDGKPPSGADSTAGVSMGGGFPPPGDLTCYGEDDISNTLCSVPRTADYGYLVNVHLDKGKRTVELRQNGIASKHLANLTCAAD